MAGEKVFEAISPDHIPETGSEVALAVSESATRTTLFPDQVIVAGTDSFSEVVLLRNEMFVAAQIATVVGRGDNTLEMKVKDNQIVQRLTDIGHVRVAHPVAVDLAMGLLKYAIELGHLEAKTVQDRIKAEILSLR